MYFEFFIFLVATSILFLLQQIPSIIGCQRIQCDASKLSFENFHYFSKKKLQKVTQVKLLPASSNSCTNSPRKVFQWFYSCSKQNLMSSINWYNQISYSLNYSYKNPEIPCFSVEILAPHSSNSCTFSSRKLFQCFLPVQLDELYSMVSLDFLQPKL